MDSPARPRALLEAAYTTGSLTTIATGGALLGLGMREGEPSRVFRLAGRGLLEGLGVTSLAAPLTSVAVGYLDHLLVASVWGLALGLVVLPRRGLWRPLTAPLAAALYTWLSVTLLPAGLRIGYAVTSSTAAAVPIGIALAVALLGGGWLYSVADDSEDRLSDTP